jgi:acyl carrier protein
MSVRSTVTTICEQVARDQRRTLLPLSDGLKVTESGLDSLSFAIIVVKLEDELGFDPFISDEAVQFPSTFGDLMRLYETRLGLTDTGAEGQAVAAEAHTAPNRLVRSTSGQFASADLGDE